MIFKQSQLLENGNIVNYAQDSVIVRSKIQKKSITYGRPRQGSWSKYNLLHSSYNRTKANPYRHSTLSIQYMDFDRVRQSPEIIDVTFTVL
jgi:hypothetical protein